MYKLNTQYIYTLYLYESIWPGENLIKDLAGFDILQQAMWQICLWTWRPRHHRVCFEVMFYFPNGKSIIWNSWLGNLSGICWCFLSPLSKSKYWWNPHQTIHKGDVIWISLANNMVGCVCVWKWSGLQQSNMAGKSISLKCKFVAGFLSSNKFRDVQESYIWWHRRLDVLGVEDILARLLFCGSS